ncbi:hypothetical protein BsWGS_24858 [Bradybaena similaris]
MDIFQEGTVIFWGSSDGYFPRRDGHFLGVIRWIFSKKSRSFSGGHQMDIFQEGTVIFWESSDGYFPRRDGYFLGVIRWIFSKKAQSFSGSHQMNVIFQEGSHYLEVKRYHQRRHSYWESLNVISEEVTVNYSHIYQESDIQLQGVIKCHLPKTQK